MMPSALQECVGKKLQIIELNRGLSVQMNGLR